MLHLASTSTTSTSPAWRRQTAALIRSRVGDAPYITVLQCRGTLRPRDRTSWVERSSNVGYTIRTGVSCHSPVGLWQIFRIGTVRYAEGLWRMRRHGPVLAHCALAHRPGRLSGSVPDYISYDTSSQPYAYLVNNRRTYTHKDERPDTQSLVWSTCMKCTSTLQPVSTLILRTLSGTSAFYYV